MVNRYSLADHTVKVMFPANFTLNGVNLGDKVITFGGPGETGTEGSFMGSIAVKRNSNLFSTEGDATGSWVHTKSLDRTGTVDMSIRQISDDIIKLIMICNALEAEDVSTGAINIEVFNGDTCVARAEDCVITKIPDQNFGKEAADQDWSWNAGRVTFPMSTTL